MYLLVLELMKTTTAQSPRPLLSSATPPLHHRRWNTEQNSRTVREYRTSEEAGWETMESVEDEDKVATRTVYLPDCSQVLG